MAAPSGRRARVTLGLAGCVPIGAAAAPGDAGPAALAAGYRAGWRIVPSPNGSRFGDHTLVQVSAGSATSAWAVGYHGGAGAFRTLIQRWDGARWALVRSPSPFDNVLAGVDTLSRASAWAVGYDSVNGYHRALIEHWDGAAWQVAPAPRAGPSDSDLWGVTALSATTRGRWATKHRHLPHLPVPAPDRALERDRLDAGPRPQPPAHRDRGHPVRHCRHLPRDIWTVGGYDTGTRFQPLIEHFDGAHWSLIPAPAPGSALLSRVSLQAPGNGWAVGIGGAVPRTQALIMHWNGHHWAPARSPAIGGSGLAGVLALTPRLAWAAGSYSPRPGVNRTLIERWDGRAWTVTPSPNRRQGSELLGIAGTQQHLWAVGDALTDTLILRH